MQYFEQSIAGVWLIQPNVYEDNRGYFMETFKASGFGEMIGDLSVVQENESLSKRGVLRGLHLQETPYEQAKLIRCVYGTIWDVVVDLRPNSSTYGEHLAFELSGANRKQLFIPRGFAHGFLTLSEEAVLQYKVNNIYNPQSERTIIYNDPMLNIDWLGQGISEEELIISEKDLEGISFDEYQRFSH